MKNYQITVLDYDPGASEVNQLNRIKLMLSVAKKNLNKNTDEQMVFQETAATKIQADFGIDNQGFSSIIKFIINIKHKSMINLYQCYNIKQKQAK